MSASIGALVLEIAARQIIPVLVTEVSNQAFRQAARSATESALKQLAAPRSSPAAALAAVRTTTVLSEMPGRVRLQVAGLRGAPARAQALDERLGALAGVREVTANTRTGTALVQYDPARITLPRILAAAEPPASRAPRRRSRGAPALALVNN